MNLGATLSPGSKQLKDGPLATWREGPDGVAVRPTQPILPLKTFDVTSPDPSSALRGVGFRSGTYVDTGGTTPLTAAPATELRGIHAPFFSDVLFPTQPWSVNYFDALGGGSTFLHTTPVQHRSGSPTPTMTRREFSNLGLQLFYSGNVTSYCPGTLLVPSPCALSPFGIVRAVTPALAAPPTISGVETSFAGDELTFKARVVGDPSAGIQSVWATWTIPPALGQPGEWAPVDLAPDADDPSLWTGVLELEPDVDPGDVHFSMWAVNGVGRVTGDDNVGALYRPGSIPGNANTPPGEPTELTFTTQPSAPVAFGQTFEVAVELTSGGDPLAQTFVDIGIGSNGMPVKTDDDGLATIELQASRTPGSYDVVASFTGDATHASSDASAPLVIVARPTTLELGGTLGADAFVGTQAVHAILKATTPTAPLHQRSVLVIFDGTGPTNTTVTEVYAGRTDPEGRIDVPSTFLSSLPVGNYAVDAYFNGVDVPGLLVLPDSPEYAPATDHATLSLRWPFSGFFSPVDNPPMINVVKAGQAVPVKFGLGGNRGLAIFQTGYPKVVTMSCPSGAPTDDLEAVTAGSSGLTFDASSGRYTYVWKTQKGWTGCRTLILRFVDGSTERSAVFKFIEVAGRQRPHTGFFRLALRRSGPRSDSASEDSRRLSRLVFGRKGT